MTASSPSPHLADHRRQIDQIDASLLELLGRRIEIGRRVAEYKRDNDVPVMQPSRVQEVLDRVATDAVGHELDPGFVRAMYRLIIDEMCRVEDEIVHGHRPG
ncbi:MAG: chorismate mutase [Acidimicrobiales bacterium]